MKYLNIKIKITLWYTLFMVTLISVILGMLVEFTDITILSNQKSQLVEVVEDAVEDIEEGDDFDYFDDGVFLLLYNNKGDYLTGSIPHNFSTETPLEAGKVQELKEKEEFYIYDQKVTNKYGENFWVRGVVSDIHSNQLTQLVLTLSFILLPILVIISSIIGYTITKRAFLPVKKIQETAQNISENNKLSLRIGLPPGKDEISMLGSTIDHMLTKLENSFLKEKQFTSDASHELRTPVTVILAESEYILQHGTNLEEAKESMEVINRQAKKMSDLINQLLFFARADQEKITLKLEKIDVCETLENLKKDNLINTKEKNISIFYKNNLPQNFYTVDRLLFIRAIQNILQNAITYNRENGIIEIETFEKGEYFAVKISDSGIGIEEENLLKIWDRFYQVDKARNSKNMGLGLSMVKIIVEQHNGYVEVESKIDVGTSFTLYFKQ